MCNCTWFYFCNIPKIMNYNKLLWIQQYCVEDLLFIILRDSGPVSVTFEVFILVSHLTSSFLSLKSHQNLNVWYKSAFIPGFGNLMGRSRAWGSCCLSSLPSSFSPTSRSPLFLALLEQCKMRSRSPHFSFTSLQEVCEDFYHFSSVSLRQHINQ
jgi:hypothetical protein